METLPTFVPSFTPIRFIATVCALGTPVQFTVTWLPDMLVVAAFPAQVAAPTALIGVGKVTTMVWLPVGLPPARHSIPRLPESGRSTSKVPAEPWVLRETAL